MTRHLTTEMHQLQQDVDWQFKINWLYNAIKRTKDGHSLHVGRYRVINFENDYYANVHAKCLLTVPLFFHAETE